MKDEDVQNKRGVVSYLFDGAEKHLNLRAFSESQKLAAYEKQDGICPICGNYFEFDQMEGDHRVPWVDGGKTTADNCQMLCKKCNREKSDNW